MPGVEAFDLVTEVLHCGKPSTGCTDAPRCFSMKLARATSQQCGLKASKIAELGMRHNSQRRLEVLMAKHVDDLKVTGERNCVLDVLKRIEGEFGAMKVDRIILLIAVYGIDKIK